jgi:hypothetical protein
MIRATSSLAPAEASIFERREQVPAAEHVQRQIAVAIIVAVEEAAFLVAMQAIVGRIQIEDDLLGRGLVRLEEEADEQALDRRRIMPDLVITARSQRRMLEPVERALAGQRGTVLAFGLELAGERREHRVVPELVVVDQILVTECDAEHALRHHRRDRVLDLRLRALVEETRREPSRQADRPIGRAEQQTAGVRRDLPAIERGHHLAPFDHFITEQVTATLCRHRGAPLRQLKSLWQKSYARFRAPMHLLAVRNPG